MHMSRAAKDAENLNFTNLAAFTRFTNARPNSRSVASDDIKDDFK